MINIEACPPDRFCDFASEHDIPVRFRFYITGPLGVGKSTTINHFRNLFVLDEWLEQRPLLLAKDWEKLTAPEKQEADQWILQQFYRKNSILRNEKEGIFVMDRGPLDPLSFTPEAEWRDKASAAPCGPLPRPGTVASRGRTCHPLGGRRKRTGAADGIYSEHRLHCE